VKRMCVVTALAAGLLLTATSGRTLAVGDKVEVTSPTEVIPDGALGFVVLNRIAQTSEKVEGVAKKIVPGTPVRLTEFIKAVGDKGLKLKGSGAVAVFPGKEEDGEPAAVGYLPVSDYKEFIGQFGPKNGNGKITEISIKDEKVLAAQRGDFAL